MGLYSNAKRMTTVFCTTIIAVTLLMLGLRLTAFSDMAMTVAADSPAGSLSSQSGELEGGNFPYRLNSKIYFPKPDARGNVLIENPESNEYLLSINILLPETKTSLYYTGTLAPGTEVASARLSAAGQKLGEGEYSCIAEVSAVDPVTLAKIETERNPVTIYIGVKP